jgi:hypothetical protein
MKWKELTVKTKFISKLRQEIVNSRKVIGPTGATFRRNESLIDQTPAQIQEKRNNRDIIKHYRFINQGRWYNLKIKLYKKILSWLDPKPVVIKEPLTDGHFDRELHHLVKDQKEESGSFRQDRNSFWSN